MTTILTIGYEGSTVYDFVATLKFADVQILIDIREIPISRKRGFSKKALTQILEDAGIKYVHLRCLGDPKPGREAARRGDMDTFQQIYRAHLESEAAQEALGEALEITTTARACLLCFERNHSGCHRTIVAEEMAAREAVQIRHIGVRHGLAGETDYDSISFGRAYAVG